MWGCLALCWPPPYYSTINQIPVYRPGRSRKQSREWRRGGRSTSMNPPHRRLHHLHRCRVMCLACVNFMDLLYILQARQIDQTVKTQQNVYCSTQELGTKVRWCPLKPCYQTQYRRSLAYSFVMTCRLACNPLPSTTPPSRLGWQA